MVVVVYYAFTDASGQFSLVNFMSFFQNAKTMGTLFYSLVIAALTTCLCLILAYPTAYILARGYVKNPLLILLVYVMPMWINFVLRLTALKEVLTAIEGNIAYYPFLNTVLAMTYDFLPFMILPIYNAIVKIDPFLWEAASDLGAGPVRTLWRVIIPLSMPGVLSGTTMVFLPAMTNYVVLDLMYNSTYIMGSLIGSYFNSYGWNRGAMVSAVLLLFIAFLSFGEKPEKVEHIEKAGRADAAVPGGEPI
ncbi:MAG: ABC transporter permease [Eubacterium sp.]|nr:ABC transporter permease [Eubacterium sp.]